MTVRPQQRTLWRSLSNAAVAQLAGAAVVVAVVLIWGVATTPRAEPMPVPEFEASVPVSLHSVAPLAFSPDSASLCYGNQAEITWMDMQTRATRTSPCPVGVRSLAFTHDLKVIFASRKHSPDVYVVESPGSPQALLTRMTGRVNLSVVAVAASNTSDALALTLSYEHVVSSATYGYEALELISGRKLDTRLVLLEGRSNSQRPVRFSGDGRFLAYPDSEDGSVKSGGSRMGYSLIRWQQNSPLAVTSQLMEAE